jgi:hypothetical protein
MRETLVEFIDAAALHNPTGLTGKDFTRWHWQRFHAGMMAVKLACRHCGLIFTYTRTQGSTGKRMYCSDWCQDDAQHAKARARKAATPRPVGVCNCGAPLPQAKTHPIKHCSKRCKDKQYREMLRKSAA